MLHVFGLTESVEKTFQHADLIALDLSREGFARLLAVLETTFAQDDRKRPIMLGPGLYGPSLFYRAVGHFNVFNVFNVCNHWTARLLDAAGVPTAPVLATLPYGLLADLRLRSGLTSEPAY